MVTQYCPQCGFELPITARYCMECGAAVSDTLGPSRAAVHARQPEPGQQLESRGKDLTAIAAAVVAYLGLRHLSRGARNTLVLMVFLFLFFGCPLICGFVMFAMEWLARLLGV